MGIVEATEGQGGVLNELFRAGFNAGVRAMREAALRSLGDSAARAILVSLEDPELPSETVASTLLAVCPAVWKEILGGNVVSFTLKIDIKSSASGLVGVPGLRV